MPFEPDWIAADWGTSHLRVYGIDGAGAVMAEAASDRGMGVLSTDQFEAALLDLVSPWLSPDRTIEIYACGMVGARQGWTEAPYGPVPGHPIAAPGPVRAPTTDSRIAVHIVPGLAQAAPADVMRGEETQIAGLLAAEPGFDGALCLPGTHSKWARLSGGTIGRFTTFMTGELFALLSRQSVLRHSMAGEEIDPEAFASGFGAGFADPGLLTGQLFGLRAASLLEGLAPAAARGRLSGLLIGAELAAARPYWQAGAVGLIGETGLAALYARGLEHAGIAPRILEARTLTLAGLAAVRAASQKD
ncbi:2-dehydro-3-deoxygalactonokinase [Pelagibacterium montanilacus]|uniref:2-dehydro-3-deoxygalactonokinase n=1 Tax=Pelagibacterium montanilacus TaxID=2185280 RepID=UPI000F8D5EA2|nr:2-dehydro-3-deoxygalactonokinase [Pelagibacterium montanilacus]